MQMSLECERRRDF